MFSLGVFQKKIQLCSRLDFQRFCVSSQFPVNFFSFLFFCFLYRVIYIFFFVFRIFLFLFFYFFFLYTFSLSLLVWGGNIFPLFSLSLSLSSSLEQNVSTFVRIERASRVCEFLFYPTIFFTEKHYRDFLYLFFFFFLFYIDPNLLSIESYEFFFSCSFCF